MNRELLNQPVTGLGPIGVLLEQHRRALLALWPSETPSIRPEVRPEGMRLHAKAGATGSESVTKSLFVRHIGIDAMWVSRPLAPGYSFANYWYQADADLSEHFFCLKPFQLQNRYWWDEVAVEALFNDCFGIVGGTSPQTGLLTVQSVSGETYDMGTGAFEGVTERLLRQGDTTPEDVVREFISPPLFTKGWDIGQVSYGGTTGIIGVRIPKGLIVCDEKGKIVWDAFDNFSIGAPPTVESRVRTWAIDDPAGVGGFVSVPKDGYYDVEFIDLNFDGRHWKQRELSDVQVAMSYTALLRNVTLDPTKTYTLKVATGTPQWVEDP